MQGGHIAHGGPLHQGNPARSGSTTEGILVKLAIVCVCVHWRSPNCSQI